MEEERRGGWKRGEGKDRVKWRTIKRVKGRRGRLRKKEREGKREKGRRGGLNGTDSG